MSCEHGCWDVRTGRDAVIRGRRTVHEHRGRVPVGRSTCVARVAFATSGVRDYPSILAGFNPQTKKRDSVTVVTRPYLRQPRRAFVFRHFARVIRHADAPTDARARRHRDGRTRVNTGEAAAAKLGFSLPAEIFINTNRGGICL